MDPDAEPRRARCQSYLQHYGVQGLLALSLSAMLTLQTLLDREQLEPILIQGNVPLCMAQYSRTFCTSRIPGLEEGNFCFK